jgi:hypothetical protein
VARTTHANFCSDAGDHIEKVGKPALEQIGKYRVNENDEEFAELRIILDCFVADAPRNDSEPHSPSLRAQAKQCSVRKPTIDRVGS